MTYKLDFEIPSLPKMTNNASGASNHWRYTHAERKKWRNAVCQIAKVRRPDEPLLKAKLCLTRYSSVSPDPDGLVSGFKSVIDGLVDAGVLVNDKVVNIGMPEYRWEKVSPRSGKIRIQVEAA